MNQTDFVNALRRVTAPAGEDLQSKGPQSDTTGFQQSLGNSCIVATTDELSFLTSSLETLRTNLLSTFSPIASIIAECDNAPSTEQVMRKPDLLLTYFDTCIATARSRLLVSLEDTDRARTIISRLVTLIPQACAGLTHDCEERSFQTLLVAIDQNARSFGVLGSELKSSLREIETSPEPTQQNSSAQAVKESTPKVADVATTLSYWGRLRARAEDFLSRAKQVALTALAAPFVGLGALFQKLRGPLAGASSRLPRPEIKVPEWVSRIPTPKLPLPEVAKKIGEVIHSLGGSGGSMASGREGGGQGRLAQDKRTHRLAGRGALGRAVNLSDRDRARRRALTPADRVSEMATLGWQTSKGNTLGKFTSSTDHFREQLAVTSVYAVIDGSGNMKRLDTLIDELPEQAREAAYQNLYQISALTLGFVDGFPHFDESEIKLPTVPGALSLPMPAGYEITGVLFKNKQDKEIYHGQEIQLIESVFGSAELQIPEHVDTVSYRVRQKKDVSISAEVISTIQGIIAPSPPYRERIAREVFTLLKSLPVDTLTKAFLWFESHTTVQPLVYTVDPFVGRFQREAKGHFVEALRSLGMGMCDSFAAYACTELNQLGIAALVISGLVPEDSGKGFNSESGHSQAATLHADGVHTLDLTRLSKVDSVDSTSLDWRVRNRLYRALPHMTAEQVFEHGERFGAVLKGDVEPPESFGALDLLRRFGGNAARNAREGEDGNQKYLTRHFFHSYPDKVQEIGNFLTGIAITKAFLQVLDEAKSFETTDEICEFEESRPSIPADATKDTSLLPDEVILEEKQLFLEAEQFFLDVLRSTHYSESDRENARAWLVSKLPLVDFDLHGYMTFSHLERGPYGTANPREMFKVLADCIPSLLADIRPTEITTLIGRVFATIQIFEVHPHLHGDAGTTLYDDFISVIDAFAEGLTDYRDHLTASHRSRIEAMMLHCAHEMLKQKRSEGVKSSLDLTLKVFKGHEGELATAIVDWVHSKKYYAYRNIRDLNSDGFLMNYLFPVGDSAVDDAVFNYLRNYLPTKVEESDSRKWQETLRLVSESSLKSVLPLLSAPTLKHFEKLTRTLEKQKKISLNWPSEHHPVSILRLKYRENDDTSLLKLAQVWCQYGVLEEQQAATIWPSLHEEGLLEDLFSDLILSPSSKDAKVRVEAIDDNDHFGRLGISLPNNKLLTSEIFSEVQELTALLDFYSRNSKTGCSHEPLLNEIKSQFPTEWQRGMRKLRGRVVTETNVSATAGSCVAALLKDHKPESLYAGLLWYASCNHARGIKRDYQEPVAAEYDKKSGSLVPLMFPSESPFSQWLPELNQLERTISYLLGELLTEVPSSHRNATVRERIREQVRYELHRHDVHPHVLRPAERFLWLHDDTQPATEAVWQMLFKAVPGSEDFFGPLSESAARGVAFLHEKCNSPFAEYLYSQTGETLVHASSGEFRDIRPYSHGDDLRRIDWRTSSRRGSLQVRQYEEQEARSLTLVLDLEYLVGKPGQELRQSAPLHHLMTLLNLAAEENLIVKLELYARTHLNSVVDVVVPNWQAGRGQVDLVVLNRMVFPLLLGAKAMQGAENTVFSGGHFPPVNLFEEGNFTPNPRQLTLFGISETNAEASQGFIVALKRRGYPVGLLRH